MDHGIRQGGRGRRLATVALLLLLVSAFTGPAAAHTGDDGFHHHDGWMGSHGGTAGYLWLALWLVVLAGGLAGLGYLVLSRCEDGSETTDDALAVLRRRYAEGEIDEEEFDARRRTLAGGE